MGKKIVVLTGSPRKNGKYLRPLRRDANGRFERYRQSIVNL